jgi:hypothetical protein
MGIGENISVLVNNHSRTEALLFEIAPGNVTEKTIEEILERIPSAMTFKSTERMVFHNTGGTDIDHGRALFLGQMDNGIGINRFSVTFSLLDVLLKKRGVIVQPALAQPVVDGDNNGQANDGDNKTLYGAMFFFFQ